jgi:hypothetical protein
MPPNENGGHLAGTAGLRRLAESMRVVEPLTAPDSDAGPEERAVYWRQAAARLADHIGVASTAILKTADLLDAVEASARNAELQTIETNTAVVGYQKIATNWRNADRKLLEKIAADVQALQRGRGRRSKAKETAKRARTKR